MISESKINLVVADEAVVHIKGSTYQNWKPTWVMFKDCFKQDLIFIIALFRFPEEPRRAYIQYALAFGRGRERAKYAIKKGYTLEKELYLRTIGFVPRAKKYDHAPNYDGLNRANSSFLRFQRQFSDTSHKNRSDPKIEKSSFQDLKIQNKEITRNIIQLINQKLWPVKDLKTKKSVEKWIYNVQEFIALEVSNENKISDRVLYYMKEILCSLPLRVYAISEIAKNKGSKTPGVDGITLKSLKDFNKMLDLLEKTSYENLTQYECSPIRRVFIKQYKKDSASRLGRLKIRHRFSAIGIPNIYDRIVQKMFVILLDPAIDVLSDPYSFGFRKSRSCHMAISVAALCLQKNPEKRTVLDYDIKGFFDNIHHDWIEQNFPMPQGFKHILHSWLKADIFSYPHDSINNESLTSGVPQGGIISPLIANFTLNGLEKAAFQNCPRREAISMRTLDEKGNKVKRDLSLNLIRYADDFIVITTSPKIELIQDNIIQYLKERGLTLNLEKSKIINMKEDKAKFTFLGYTFTRFEKMKQNRYTSLLDSALAPSNNRLLVVPSKDKFIAFRKKLKDVISKHQNSDAITLIKNLNPILRGWALYFGLGTTSQILGSIDAYVYNRLMNWMKKKYPKTSISKLTTTYFGCKGSSFPESTTYSPYGLQWHFHSSLNNPTPYALAFGRGRGEIANKRDRSKVLWLVRCAYTNNRIPVWYYAFSKEILKISPYLTPDVYSNRLQGIKEKRIRIRSVR
jgi:RNA-directed DNA polymerase